MVSFENRLMAPNNSTRLGMFVPPNCERHGVQLPGARTVTLSRPAGSRVMTEMDRDAFDEVYDAYRPRLFAFLLRMSRSRTVAEDLLDEVWLRLARHARDLRPDTRIGPWLFTVARNLYWSHRRSAVLEETVGAELLGLWPSPAPWPSPFDLAAAGELERRLELALSTLPPQQREVVLLVAEGMTPSEAARVCGIAPEALRQRLSRAR